jgi:hypothetical protein
MNKSTVEGNGRARTARFRPIPPAPSARSALINGTSFHIADGQDLVIMLTGDSGLFRSTI